MTLRGYALLAVLLALGAMGGAYLAMPPAPARTVTCEAFLEHPTVGRVRLVGCQLDARALAYHGDGPAADDVLVSVRPGGWWDSPAAALTREEDPPTVVLFSDAPRLRGAANEALGFDDDALALARLTERHPERFILEGDIEGEVRAHRSVPASELVELDRLLLSDVVVIESRGGTSGKGMALLGACLLALALLTWFQMRWTRSRQRLTGEAPTQF